jgi:chitin disaccharide deacetylase
MLLIINADDLGRSLEVNEAIFALMDRGLVTSASLMANGPRIEEALAGLGRFPRCSFGIHLNVTEFSPVTSQPALDCLLDQEGNFSLGKFRQAVFHRPLLQAVLGEWAGQVRKLKAAGLSISHIDSHQGVHTDGRLFWILKRLQRQFGIRKVRIRDTIAPGAGRLFLRSRLWNLALRLIYPTRTTVLFTDFSSFLQVAPSLEGRYPTLEVMVHPGHPGYAGETASLLTSWREQLPFPVHLASYHGL